MSAYLADESLLGSVELGNGVHILFAVISKAVSACCLEDDLVGLAEVQEETSLLVLLDSVRSDFHIVVVDEGGLGSHNEWKDVG